MSRVTTGHERGTAFVPRVLMEIIEREEPDPYDGFRFLFSDDVGSALQ